MKPKNAPEKPHLPPVNHYLMPDSVYPQVHWNPAATDVTEVPVWTGSHRVKDDHVQWLPLPTGAGAALHSYPNGEEAVYFSGGDRVSKIRLTDGSFELIVHVTIPRGRAVAAEEKEIRDLVDEVVAAGTNERKFLPPLKEYMENHKTSGDTLMNGGYTVLDRDRNFYAGWGTTIYKIADVDRESIDSKLHIARSFDLNDGLRPEDKDVKIERLTGVAMTYDGHLVVAMPGIVAVLDRDFHCMKYVLLTGEAVDNGVTTDVDGGIYLVTSKYMRKLVWKDRELSEDEAKGAWKCEYDIASVPNPNALSRGAGNTPTLMGFEGDPHKLVLIADAAREVKVVAFWRDEIPADFQQVPGTDSRRIAGQRRLTIDVPATIEWSPHVYGYDAMVFASAWPEPVSTEWPKELPKFGKLDLIPTVLTAGVSRKAPVGAEKLAWDPGKCKFTRRGGWTRDLPLQWGLHPISTVSKTVHLCGVRKGVYLLTAIDWKSGKVVGETTLGRSPIFNAMGGVYIPMANGDLFITGVFGPLRITKPGAAPL